jgi:hypothetical protein
MLGLLIASTVTTIIMQVVNINKKNFNMFYKIGTNLFLNFASSLIFFSSISYITMPLMLIPMGIVALISFSFFIFNNFS